MPRLRSAQPQNGVGEVMRGIIAEKFTTASRRLKYEQYQTHRDQQWLCREKLRNKRLITLKVLSLEIFMLFWLEGIYLGLNSNHFWFFHLKKVL